MYNLWRQGEKKTVLITRTLNWSWEPLQAPVMYTPLKAIMPLPAQTRILVVVEATKETEVTQNGGKKKFMGTCNNNRDKLGHIKTDCWACTTLYANKSKRPNGYRGGTTEHVTADVVTTEDDEIEYVLCVINDDIGVDEFVFAYAEVSLYNIHLGYIMYDDFIMPGVKKEEEEIIILTVINFPGNMKMLSNPNIWIGEIQLQVCT
jgi:hypothetical protein